VRWADRYGKLERYNFLFDAESCRRTIEESCWSREQYRPPNAMSVLREHEGEWGEVLVMMTGYNDSRSQFAPGVEAIVAEAREQGIGSVVWLSLRTKGVNYEEPMHLANGSTYREANRSLYELADEYGGFLQIADWGSFSADHPEWFEADGAHLAPRGVDQLTRFIAAHVEAVLDGDTVTPDPPPWEEVREGDTGDPVVQVQRALVDAGLYENDVVDGAFGPQTAAAVAELQRRADLAVTGAVDESTAIELGLHSAPPADDETTPGGTTAPPPQFAPTPLAPPTAADERSTDAGTVHPTWWIALALLPGLVWVGRRWSRSAGWRRRRPAHHVGVGTGEGRDPLIAPYDQDPQPVQLRFDVDIPVFAGPAGETGQRSHSRG
jgi:hypothetical protein